MWFRRKPKPSGAPSSSDPAEVMRQLREQALTLGAAELGLERMPRGGVWGVLMETGIPNAAVSLVSFADGTTSLYFSSGGRVLGAGAHVRVRAVADAFLARVAEHLAHFTPARTTPLPAPGRVRFYVRSTGGTLTAEAGEEDLGQGRHALSPVFHAGHSLITAVRQHSEPA
jgi:hypothetical protein